MKQRLKDIQAFAKIRFIIPITIALNLVMMLSFILLIVSAIQNFK